MKVSLQTVAVVHLRANHRCEVCGIFAGHNGQIHHRRPRQMGGSKRPDTNTASNLLLLCLGCHSWAESRRGNAYDLGLLVRQAADPAEVPVLLLRPGWVFLTDDGLYVPVERSAA